MRKETIIDSITHDGQLSVCIITYDDDKGSTSEDESPIEFQRNRIVLSPGDFDTARQWLPDDVYEQTVSVWTAEVIEAWKAKKATLMAELDAMQVSPQPPDYTDFLRGMMEGFVDD